jgi:hypothetical protein
MRLVASSHSLTYTQYGINIANIIATTVEMLKEGHLMRRWIKTCAVSAGTSTCMIDQQF